MQHAELCSCLIALPCTWLRALLDNSWRQPAHKRVMKPLCIAAAAAAAAGMCRQAACTAAWSLLLLKTGRAGAWCWLMTAQLMAAAQHTSS
jgi:hypothetical protein